MNTFLFETRQLARSAVSWIVSLSGLTALFIAGLFPMYNSAKEELTGMLDNFPPIFKAFFGMMGDVFSIPGFLSFGFIYLAMIGSIFATNMTLSAFTREKRAKSLDFLLTKPKSRSKLFMSKYLAAITWIMIGSVLYVGVFLYSTHYASPETPVDINLVLASLVLPGLMLLYASIGTFIGVWARRVRSVAGTATMVGMFSFTMASLYNLLEKDALRVLTPLKYIDMFSLLQGKGTDVIWVFLAIGLTLAAFLLAWIRFVKADVPAA